jgi:hypothetical protein
MAARSRCTSNEETIDALLEGVDPMASIEEKKWSERRNQAPR